MNEPIANKLDRVRPTLPARLRDHPSGDAIPDDLKNAVTVYLLLNPEDGEVRQARDNLLGKSPQSLRGPDLRS